MVDKCERILDAIIETRLESVYHFNSYEKYEKATEKDVIERCQRRLSGESKTEKYIYTFYHGNVPSQTARMLERYRKKWKEL